MMFTKYILSVSNNGSGVCVCVSCISLFWMFAILLLCCCFRWNFFFIREGRRIFSHIKKIIYNNNNNRINLESIGLNRDNRNEVTGCLPEQIA